MVTKRKNSRSSNRQKTATTLQISSLMKLVSMWNAKEDSRSSTETNSCGSKRNIPTCALLSSSNAQKLKLEREAQQVTEIGQQKTASSGQTSPKMESLQAGTKKEKNEN